MANVGDGARDVSRKIVGKSLRFELIPQQVAVLRREHHAYPSATGVAELRTEKISSV
jgi:hypothetical protein